MTLAHRHYGNLKFNQLQLLAALGEFGSLRRAAETLNMAQPVATRILRDLECRLGVVLFDRSRRGMVPTFYGTAMIRHAALMLSHMARAQGDLEALSRGASGVLRIGAVISIAPILLPRTVARINAIRPALSVSLFEATHEVMLDQVANGDLDVVLARRMPARLEQELDYEVLYHEEARIVSGPRHPLAGAECLDWEDVVDRAWVLPPEVIPLRQYFDGLFFEKTGRRPMNVVESVSIATNQTLLQEAEMLGTLPRGAAEYYARLGLIRVLPIDVSAIRLPVALIWRKARPSWPALDVFFDAVRTVAATIGTQGDTPSEGPST